ncbi:MAG: prolyl oligopeptidase family serine peptidase [Planctomycetes bacterium]|nr:prolyl oligopeptidase family serine peptidase [Planctomycetota bacterium]
MAAPAELAATPLQGPATLAPDGAHALLHARTPGLGRRLTLVESAPEDRLQPRTLELDYDKPGDALATDWPILLDLATGVFHALDRDLLAEPDRLDHETWSPDGARLYFRYVARGHQCARWLCADAASGALRVVLEERSDTFLDDTQKGWVRYLPATDEVLWMSERSGFNHLYRFAANGDGALHAVTAGDWLVRSVESVDAAAGTLEFTALGVYPDQDPYHVHYGRVHLDGSGLTWLTEGDGTHELRYAPDRASFVDTYSRVDLPPVAELRRSADGARLAELGAADVAALVATGWRAPERFAAPGRDGVTPIWGVLHVPQDFDPERRYPVIEHVYAGPHGCFVPKRFAPFHGVEDLCELGFVVVQIDGMGTNWRSKAFHDVCWKDLADSGFPDRIAWMRAAAATRPWMDLARVGIYGGSAGGQSALRAVLDHPDVYRAAAADCGCHDNRMDKRWWNEAWLGYPVDASYLASSNVADAHRLGAPLLLTVGALDRNVDPSSTLQVVQALIDADKDFELVVFPRGGHGAGDSAYGVRRRRDFFVRHLLGVEPRR